AAPLARLPGATMVALSVVAEKAARPPSGQRRQVLTEEATRDAVSKFEAEEHVPDFHSRIVRSPSPANAIHEELQQGYDLVFVGAGRRRTVANRVLTAALLEGGASSAPTSSCSGPCPSSSAVRPSSATPSSTCCAPRPARWRCS